LNKKQISLIAATALLAVSHITWAADIVKAKKPLKIYILAGQSNMQGKAAVSAVPRMALSPESKALHDKILDETGKPRVHKNVSIVYFTGGDEKDGEDRPLKETKGLLSTGFGGEIGPELGFGVTMGEANDQPILIIKTAWGGKSLCKNFRPPSAGVLPVERDKKAQKLTDEEWQKDKTAEEAEQGAYYRLMVQLVKKVLADPSPYCEAYDPKQGYEITGFGWFQGYNDMIGGSSELYKAAGERPQFAAYTELLAQLIRDLRKDLNAPKMLAVIGVMGIGGESNKTENMLAFRKAMAAVADIPEFKGNVTAVPTAPFWDNEVEDAVEKVSQAEALWDYSTSWKAVGTPAPKDRIWHYTSFTLEDEKMYAALNRWERIFTNAVPAGMEAWLKPDFDTSTWQKGPAPIAKGTAPVAKKVGKKKGQEQEKEEPKAIVGSPWGEGNMLLAKTTFTLEGDDTEHFRLCIRSTRSFHVYLNGQLIHSYPWWKEDEIRKFEIDAKAVKPGVNELAFYGNIQDHKGVFFNAIDVYLEGLSKADTAELKKEQDKIAPSRIRELAKGKSNQEFHYLGSAYTYSLIGEALAKEMSGLEKNSTGDCK
jgi:Carbohydrate esterase, sialic acid-specific acetylesterase